MQPERRANRHGDHVARQQLAESDSGVVATGHDVHEGDVDDELQRDASQSSKRARNGLARSLTTLDQ